MIYMTIAMVHRSKLSARDTGRDIAAIRSLEF